MILRQTWSIPIALLVCCAARAEYTETLSPDGPVVNCAEHGLVDDEGRSDQSDAVWTAVHQIAKTGGRLIISKGTYSFTEVEIPSNVHVFVEKGTVLKPVKRGENAKPVFTMGTRGPAQNVSIRGLGGRFSFSLEDFTKDSKVRCIAAGDVNNFLISDVDVHDVFSVWSSIIFSSPRTTKKTGFVGPTGGTIKDCSIFNASIGYGLVQAHAAKSVHFENLYALGGVAMRLECGVRPKNPLQKNGLFDITGKNIRCENGYVALLLGPHSTECGVVTVDGIETTSCEFAVKNVGGFISSRKQHEGDKPGTFAPGSIVRNVRAINGDNAQRSPLHVRYTPTQRLKEIRDADDGNVRGPSITAVLDQAENYKVIFENVEAIGFDGVAPIIDRDAAYSSELKDEIVKRIRAGQPLGGE